VSHKSQILQLKVNLDTSISIVCPSNYGPLSQYVHLAIIKFLYLRILTIQQDPIRDRVRKTRPELANVFTRIMSRKASKERRNWTNVPY